MSIKPGQKWKVVANGKRSLNGARYSVTRAGDVVEADGDTTIYDALRELTDFLEDALPSDLEHVDSIQVTIFPSNTSGEPRR